MWVHEGAYPPPGSGLLSQSLIPFRFCDSVIESPFWFSTQSQKTEYIFWRLWLFFCNVLGTAEKCLRNSHKINSALSLCTAQGLPCPFIFVLKCVINPASTLPASPQRPVWGRGKVRSTFCFLSLSLFHGFIVKSYSPLTSFMPSPLPLPFLFIGTVRGAGGGILLLFQFFHEQPESLVLRSPGWREGALISPRVGEGTLHSPQWGWSQEALTCWW